MSHRHGLKFGVQRTFHVIACVIFMCSCCVFDSPRLSLPLLAVYLLSYRPVHSPGSQLLLLRCGGQIPCALALWRTLAPLPSTTLTQKHLDNFFVQLEKKLKLKRVEFIESGKSVLFLGDYNTKFKDKITLKSKDAYVDNMLAMMGIFIPSSCAHGVVVLTLCESFFYFLLSIFPPVVFFYLPDLHLLLP